MRSCWISVAVQLCERSWDQNPWLAGLPLERFTAIGWRSGDSIQVHTNHQKLRYLVLTNFRQECIVAPFTGDNPASVIAVSAPGDALLSLGTSTTFLLSVPPATKPPKRFTNSHLLTHPTDPPHAFIAMLCYKNGALAREQVRDKYAQADWDRFNEHVNSTPAGNNGYLGFYFPLPEIIPPNVLGNFFYSTDLAGRELDVIPTNAHPRAILESQLLSIKSRLAKMLPPNSPPLQRLVVTGGSSTNQTIRQVAAVSLSDVFQAMRISNKYFLGYFRYESVCLND